ncbi:MAG: PIN domain-containing protein, partial [Mycobacterium sp.]
MALIRVVLDACVMLPQNLNNVLLTLAEEGLFTPVWTDTLLNEVRTNLVKKFGTTTAQAEHRIQQMQRAFPLAADEARGYEQLIPAMTNDRKDRHVLAAAVASGAALIVTANLRDFPAAALE